MAEACVSVKTIQPSKSSNNPNDDSIEETHLLMEENVVPEIQPADSSFLSKSSSGMALSDGSYTAARTTTELELCIYLRDLSVIPLTLVNGQHAQTEDLFKIVREELPLSQEVSNAFALWLVSPLLELRLKKYHHPYYLVQQWPELCKMYSDEKLDNIFKDSPLLMLQRNVFFSKEEEKNIQDETALSMLYREAQCNLFEGRYVVDKAEYDYLAAIQFILEEGIQDKSLTPLQKSNLDRYYPDFLCKKRWPLPGMKNPLPHEIEVRVEEEILKISRNLSSENNNKVHLYRLYLDVFWNKPFYGGAFFSATVNRPASKLQMMLGVNVIQVWVCINSEGICIIEKDKEYIDLAVPFIEMSWHFHDNAEDNKLPALFVQFLVKDSEETLTKLLEINSRQAKLMNALIESMVKRKLLDRQRRSSTRGYDTVDGLEEQALFKKSLNRLKRLSLDTYTVGGEPVN
ncbi:putative FERM domain-containing protein FRMD8P1 isoform X1 [Argonauta hians]